MHRLNRVWRAPRSFFVGLAVGLVLATSGLVVAADLHAPNIITPKKASDVTNLDVLRLEIKNYYGTPGAATGSGSSAGWTLPLNEDSNYANEASKVAKEGRRYLNEHAGDQPRQAIIFDVDDTTLTTWDYELFSNWDFNPGTNTSFVGGSAETFTGNLFPATPGMVRLAEKAKDWGYSIFFITGRGDSQHQQTIANLVNDHAAGYSDIDSVDFSGATLPEQDAGYPMPTAIDTGHGGYADGLFTKPPVGSYPDYLDTPAFCGPSIDAGSSCPTQLYKSGTRAYIESQGYTIVANFGDQFSDLFGGYSMRKFKMPNPNYYLP